MDENPEGGLNNDPATLPRIYYSDVKNMVASFNLHHSWASSIKC